jgi:hypothetical protein
MSGFACQSNADACLGDSECATDYRCVLQNGARTCVKSCALTPGSP